MDSNPPRRFLEFIALGSGAGLLSAAAPNLTQQPSSAEPELLSLDGIWQFKIDPQGVGESEH